jgi:hypothetical protein
LLALEKHSNLMPQVAMPLTNIAKEIYRLAIQDGHG